MNWQSVTYGNGRFVAVGGSTVFANNIAVYSNDGIDWTQATLPSSQVWISVTYGNGIFVTVANTSNVYAYSNNGIDWTQSTMPSSRTWLSVTYGNGRFVAVAGNLTNVSAYTT
jgi:hypothetical protein